MKAKEAREKADAVLSIAKLYNVYRLIEKAAERGEHWIDVPDVFDEHQLKHLKALGYNLRQYVEDGTGDNKPWENVIRISWKSA